MPQVNNIEHLRRWFRQCPSLVPDNHLRVDYMAEHPTEYSLFASPSTIAYKENVLGEVVMKDIQRLNYIFASREDYGADERQNAANYGFYQDVIDWINEQNKNRNFPRMEGGMIISIHPTLTAYVNAPGVDSAMYQIQIEIIYKVTD